MAGEWPEQFCIIDPNPANTDPLERVFHNVDFKVGSMTSTPWTYTPVSGAGGAPAVYDRVTTNVRWVFAGTLSRTAPDNTGSVSFTARIK